MKKRKRSLSLNKKRIVKLTNPNKVWGGKGNTQETNPNSCVGKKITETDPNTGTGVEFRISNFCTGSLGYACRDDSDFLCILPGF